VSQFAESPDYIGSMPRHRPATSGYARIAQADEEDGHVDDSDGDTARPFPTISTSVSQYAPIQPKPHGQMYAGRSSSPYGSNKRPNTSKRRIRRRSSGVDIKAINARLERWAEEIASKFKINRVRGKTAEEEHLEIQHSVFQAPEGMRPASAETLASDFSDEQGDRMTKLGFDDVVESVKVAIELGVHPKMISQGSSGSYFARNSEGKVVGVFKPKDEEPYASRNPKWTKWIHRNLFPCFFGRECLIPNLSYVSEAAAYVLDTRLRTHLVPYTDIVYLSSKSFYYDFWDRTTYYRKRKPLPAKVGSFQVFLKGFKDANLFLRDHPWPDRANSGFRPQDAPKRKKRPWGEACRPSGPTSDDDYEEETMNEARSTTGVEDAQSRPFTWTETLQQLFKEELEKLVVLDYIMRNTDRGLDNWMVRVDSLNQEVTIISAPPRLNGISKPHPLPVPTDAKPYKRQESMTTKSRSGTPSNSSDPGQGASISIGAIDNSLSWPWKHPDAVGLFYFPSRR
jgi:phosphatidylinositol 4-kinase type 2